MKPESRECEQLRKEVEENVRISTEGMGMGLGTFPECLVLEEGVTFPLILRVIKALHWVCSRCSL